MKYLAILLLTPVIAFASVTGDFQQCIESLCGDQEQIAKNLSKQTPIDLSYYTNHLQRLDNAITNSYSALTQSLQSIKQLPFNQDSVEQLDLESVAYLLGVNLLKQGQLLDGQYDQLLQEVKRLEEQQTAKYPWRNSQLVPIDSLISSYTRQLNVMTGLISEESAYDPFAEDYFAPYVDYVERWLDHPEMLNHNDLSQISETMGWLSHQLGYKKAKTPRVSCVKHDCKAFITDGIFKLFQQTLENDRDQCKTTFLDVVKSAPTSEEILSFRKVIRNSIKRIEQRVYPHLNLDSSAIEKIDQLDISLPRNRETLAKDTLLFLEKISNSNIKRWKQLEDQSISQLIKYLADSRFNLNADFASVCSKLTSRVTDHYNHKNHLINISEYSAKNPSFGAYIFSHEMGHVISKVVATQTKIRVNACLKKLHKNNSELLGANHFVEEDFADMVAAIATYDSNKNGACLFWYHDAKNHEYNIGVKSIYNYSLHDKHSSNFFRLMHLQEYRSEGMPMSCELGLQQIEDHATIHRCL